MLVFKLIATEVLATIKSQRDGTAGPPTVVGLPISVNADGVQFVSQERQTLFYETYKLKCTYFCRKFNQSLFI